MSKSACQTPCQLTLCFFIFLTHSYFSFLSFYLFIYLFICTSQNLSAWKLVQCVHANYLCIKMGWREESNLEVPCFFTFFFTASPNKISFHYLKNDFCNPKVQECNLKTEIWKTHRPLVNWLGSQGKRNIWVFLCKSCRIFGSMRGNRKKNESNYKQTQIINHPWSISAFLELQESQTHCSRALNNNLSSVI